METFVVPLIKVLKYSHVHVPDVLDFFSKEHATYQYNDENLIA